MKISDNHSRFDVFGKIRAQGENGAKVIFTPYPEPNYLRGEFNIHDTATEAIFTHCVFQNSESDGLRLFNNANISFSVFNNNSRNGVFFEGLVIDTTTVLYHNEIYSNQCGIMLNSLYNNDTGVYDYPSPIIDMNWIHHNISYSSEFLTAGIRATGGQAKIRNNNIEANQSTSGIWNHRFTALYLSGNVLCENNIIKQNITSNESGWYYHIGATIYIAGGVIFRNNSVIENVNNYAYSYLNAVMVAYNDVLIENNYFSGNSTYYTVLYSTDNSLVKNNHFINTLTQTGSYSEGIAKICGHTQFIKNRVTSNTGGYAVSIYDQAYMDNNTIANNYGGIEIFSSSPTIKNNIISENTLEEIGFYTSNSNLFYNLIYDNDPGLYLENGGSAPFGFLNNANLNVNSTFCDPYSNISVDPAFVNPQNGNYLLNAFSPAVNAGDPLSPADPDGSIVDMGYRSYSISGTPNAWIVLPANTHNYSNVLVGDTAIWSMTLRNIGQSPLVIDSLTFNTSDFYQLVALESPILTAQRNNLKNKMSSKKSKKEINQIIGFSTHSRNLRNGEVSIQPNESVDLQIAFNPDHYGSFVDTLRIYSNADNNHVSMIVLTGNAVNQISATLSMPVNIPANIGTVVTMPVMTTNLSGLIAVSYNFNVSYDTTKVEFVSIDNANTMSENWFATANPVNGVLHVGGAGVQSLVGAGTLVNLNFRVRPNQVHNSTAILNIEDPIINDGSLFVQSTYGSILIKNVIYGDVDANNLVQAYDAALTLQYSVMMDPLPTIDPRPWIDWRFERADVSGDNHIYAYDASLILQYTVGLITQFPVESTHISHYTNPEGLVTISQANSELCLTATDVSRILGLNIEVPIVEGLSLGDTQFGESTQNWLKVSNQDNQSYRVAMANCGESGQNISLIKIPFTTENDLAVPISLTVNDDTLTIVCTLNPLSNDNPTLPLNNKVSQNYPNPFNPDTKINLAVKEDSKVKIVIYNIKGQKVKSLADGHFKAGYHTLIWNGKDDQGKRAASGIYFYRTEIGNEFKQTRKMLMMK